MATKQRDGKLLLSTATNYNLVVDVLLTLQPKNQGGVSGDAVGRKLKRVKLPRINERTTRFKLRKNRHVIPYTFPVQKCLKLPAHVTTKHLFCRRRKSPEWTHTYRKREPGVSGSCLCVCGRKRCCWSKESKIKKVVSKHKNRPENRVVFWVFFKENAFYDRDPTVHSHTTFHCSSPR